MEGATKKHREEDYDVVVPIPRFDGDRSPAQRWLADQFGNNGFYFNGDPWTVSGEAYVFPQGKLETITHAELRFGKNDCMAGLEKVCLWAYFNNDDKHRFENMHWCSGSQTIYGTALRCAVMFKVHPFQFSALKRLQQVVGVTEDNQIFLGGHKLLCMRLKEQYEK